MQLLAFFGAPGPLEMIIVLVIILLLFGNRLPSLMRSMGRGVVEFKRGISGQDDEVAEVEHRAKTEKKTS